MNKKIVGYWYWKLEPQYPMPIAAEIPFANKSAIIQALKAKEQIVQPCYCKGFSRCRICGKTNGSIEFHSKNFIWPEGYAHYLEDHNVEPDPEFVKWLLK